MAQLLAWCDAGACGIAPVTGDAGIGKTWTSIVGRDGDAGFGQWRWLHEIAVPGRGDPLDGAVLVLVHVPAPHALQPVVRAALRAEVGVAGGPGVVLGGAWCRSREMPPERGSVTCRRQVLDGSAASSRACDLTGPVGERDRRLPGTVMFPGDGSSAGLVQDHGRRASGPHLVEIVRHERLSVHRSHAGLDAGAPLVERVGRGPFVLVVVVRVGPRDRGGRGGRCDRQGGQEQDVHREESTHARQARK